MMAGTVTKLVNLASAADTAQSQLLALQASLAELDSAGVPGAEAARRDIGTAIDYVSSVWRWARENRERMGGVA